MAFRYSAEDVARSSVVESIVWVPVEVVDHKTERNKKGDADNEVVDFKVIGGEYKGLMLRAWFSEKAPSMAFPYMRAFGHEPTKGGGEFSFEATKGRQLKICVKPGTYNDKPSNEIADYASIDASVGDDAE